MATTPIYIPKGTDLTVNLTIYQSDGTTPLNLAIYTHGDLYLYQIGNKKIIEKYSVISSTGYQTLTITNAATGEVQFNLSHTVTRKCKDGELYAFVRASNGTYYYGQSKVLVGVIVDSVGGAYDVP